MNIIKFSQKTKRDADSLLKYGNVLEILSKFGRVFLTGSHSYDLMYGPDIDITVLSNNPEESSFDALKDFTLQRKFQKYQLGDFIKFPLEGRPQGLIVVLIHEFKGRKWEIEIWFQKFQSQNHEYYKKLLSTASDEQRKTILELKHQREKSALSKNKFDSTTIYKGVLCEGKINIKDF